MRGAAASAAVACVVAAAVGLGIAGTRSDELSVATTSFDGVGSVASSVGFQLMLDSIDGRQIDPKSQRGD
jgi:hypothetical protein